MADVFNIFDAENFTKEFIKKEISKTNSEVDVSSGSAFDDLFITPLVPIIQKLVQTLSSIDYKTNLKYAHLLSEAELDEIGTNNYFMEREAGSRSTGTETFIFGKIADDTTVIIPAGVILSDDSENYRFITSRRITLTHDDLLSYYDSHNMDYRVPVPIVATEEGSAYNLSEGKITKCLTSFSSVLTGVTNETKMDGGKDKETNAVYAERIRSFYSTRQLGTKPGYRQDVLSAADVSSVVVVGKGDELMTRDKIHVLNEDALISTAQYENGYDNDTDEFLINPVCIYYDEKINAYRIPSSYLKHVGYGGKVDIYVKGTTYESCETALNMPSPLYLLGVEISNIDGINLKANGSDTEHFYLEVSNTGEIMTYYTPKSFYAAITPPRYMALYDNRTEGKTLQKYNEEVFSNIANDDEEIEVTGLSVKKIELELATQGKDVSVGLSPENLAGLFEQKSIQITTKLSYEFSSTAAGSYATISELVDSTGDSFGIRIYPNDDNSIKSEIINDGEIIENTLIAQYISSGATFYIQLDLEKTDEGYSCVLYCSSNGTKFEKVGVYDVKLNWQSILYSLYKGENATSSGRLMIYKVHLLSSDNEKTYSDFEMQGSDEVARESTPYELFNDELSEISKQGGISSYYKSNIRVTEDEDNNNVLNCSVSQNWDSGYGIFNTNNWDDSVVTDKNAGHRHKLLAIPINISGEYVNLEEEPSDWNVNYGNYYKFNGEGYVRVTQNDAFIIPDTWSQNDAMAYAYYCYDEETTYFERQTHEVSESEFAQNEYYVSNFANDIFYNASHIEVKASKFGKIDLEYRIKANIGYELFQTEGDYMKLAMALKSKESGILQTSETPYNVESWNAQFDEMQKNTIVYHAVQTTKYTSGERAYSIDYLGLPWCGTWTFDECVQYADANGIFLGDCVTVAERRTRIAAYSVSLKVDKLYNLTYKSLKDVAWYLGWSYSDLNDLSLKEIKEAIYAVLATMCRQMCEKYTFNIDVYAKRIDADLYADVVAVGDTINGNETLARGEKCTIINNYFNAQLSKVATTYVSASTSPTSVYETTISATNQNGESEMDISIINRWTYVKLSIDSWSKTYQLYTKNSADDTWRMLGSTKGLAISDVTEVAELLIDFSWYFDLSAGSKRYSDDNNIFLDDIKVIYSESEESTESNQYKSYLALDPFVDSFVALNKGYTIVTTQGGTDAIIVIYDPTYSTNYRLYYNFVDEGGNVSESEISIDGMDEPLIVENDTNYIRYIEQELTSPVNDLYAVKYISASGNEVMLSLRDDNMFENYRLCHRNMDNKDISESNIEWQSSQEKSYAKIFINNPFNLYYDNANNNYYTRFPFVNNTKMTLMYSANTTLSELGSKYNEGNDRIITTDVLVKESEKTYVNIWLEISAYDGTDLTSAQKADIISDIRNYISSLPLNAELQMSDLITYLSTSSSASYVDYINLPARSFYTTNNNLEALKDQNYNDVENVLYAGKNKYFELGQCKIIKL